MHWYAPCRGISGVAWGHRLFESLRALFTSMPAFLFVHVGLSAKHNLSTNPPLSARAGTKSCVHRCMWQLLQQPPLSMSAAEAKQFTGHSPRHFHPTVAGLRQIPLMERNQIGHWAPGSLMPVRYDTEKGWSEVTAKLQNIRALQAVLPPHELQTLPASVETAWWRLACNLQEPAVEGAARTGTAQTGQPARGLLQFLSTSRHGTRGGSMLQDCIWLTSFL